MHAISTKAVAARDAVLALRARCAEIVATVEAMRPNTPAPRPLPEVSR